MHSSAAANHITDCVQVDATQYPADSLVATGQVTSTEHGPYVSIWDSRAESDRLHSGSHTTAAAQPKPSVPHVDSSESLPELRRIELDKDYRGVGALAFSPNGKLLVAVALDNFHSVMVFDWRAGTALSEGRGFAGEPPQVRFSSFAVRQSPCTSQGRACTRLPSTVTFTALTCSMGPTLGSQD